MRQQTFTPKEFRGKLRKAKFPKRKSQFQKIKERYFNQDNRIQAWPMYLELQELKPIAWLPDYPERTGGFDKVERIFINDAADSEGESYSSIEDLMESLAENLDDDFEEFKDEIHSHIEDFKEVYECSIWTPVEIFLTQHDIDLYIKHKAHRHSGPLRTYGKTFLSHYDMWHVMKEAKMRARNE